MLRLRRQSEALGRKSEMLHQALVESSSDQIFMLDANGTYVTSNDRVEHFGLERGDELVGKTIDQVYPKEVALFYRTQLQRVLSEGKTVVFEHDLPSEHATHYHVDTLYPVNLPDGTVMVGGICRDITERKQAEEQLRQAEWFARSTLDSLYAHIAILNAEGVILAVNQAWRRFAETNGPVRGNVCEGANYLAVCEAAQGDDQSIAHGFAAGIHRILSGEAQEFALEYPCHSPDEQRWFIGRVTRFAGEGPVRVVVSHENITERKQAEEALRKQEHFISATINTSPVIVYVYDMETKSNVFVNAGIEKILNYSPQEVQAMGTELFDSLIHPDDLIPVIEFQQQVTAASDEEVLEIEYRMRHADGSWRTLRSYERVFLRNADGSLKQKVGVALDITDRKEAEKELVKSEQRYRSVFENTGAAMIIVNEDGTIAFANRRCAVTTGYSPEELQGTDWRGYVFADDLPMMENYFRLRFSDPEKTPNRYETRLIHADGSTRHCVLTADIIPPTRQVVVSILDITDRIRAEETRRVLETAIDNTIECIMVSDRENRLTYVNRAFEKLTGYSVAEALGNTPGMLKSGQHDREFYQDLKSTIYSGHPWQGNLTLRKKNGEFYAAYVTITPICDPAGIPEHFVSVHRDVTRERELEQRIQQNQRLEAIGTLAGGIAHDFNNLLSPIMGYTELCMDNLTTGSKVKEDLEEVMRPARRATDLVRQILSFSRRSNREQKPFRVASVVKEALKLLRAIIPTSIDIHQEISGATETVVADPTEIHQVVMNLCTNAFHAMPDGGDLTVTLKAVDLDRDASVLFPDSAPGRYLNLSVEDTGLGIDPEIRDKIFEPYFTTKEEGRGTGLGLAVTHSIVSACGGGITVHSEPGKGTRFNLYFPVAEDTATEVVEKATITGSGHESILFIDDDAVIVSLGKRTLERCGYSVTTSMDPVQALELFKKAPADFDMVITDMTMPVMTGDLLTEALLKIRPDLPVIVCTGFSERMNKEKAQEMGIRRLLDKPVEPGTLLATIRESFDCEEC